MTLTEIVGWSLVHSVWVGAAVAGLLFLLLRVVDERRAALRYGASCGALLILAVAPVGAALRMRPDRPSPAPQLTEAAGPAERVPADPGAIFSPPPSEKKHGASSSQSSALEEPRALETVSAAESSPLALQLRALFPWMVLLWVIGVVVLSARLVATWLRVQRLRTRGTEAVSPSHQATLQKVLHRLAISRPVQLLQSTIIEVPAVIGWLRPVVLIPVTLLNGLTITQLEAILAHELAHIRRHDYLINLMQVVIETLLFYHPAAWWVSRQVRETREHCCDDIAVQVAGNPADYARALLALEEHRVLALLPAASGGNLLGRVRRLVAPKVSHAETFPRWIAAAIGVAAVLTLGGGAGLAGKSGVIEGQQQPQPIPAFSDQSAPVSPDTVIRHPDPSAPLARRWEWARQLGAANRYKAFWIGYTIEPMPALKGSVFISRMERRGILGEGGLDLRGRISNFGNFNGFSVPGVLLPPLIGGGDLDDVALLYAFALDSNGTPVLARVHISSLTLPVDLEDRPLLWLGPASDEESVPLALSLYQSAPAKLKEDVVAAVGVHGDDRLAVPPLIRWLTGDEPTNTRTEAAEWLARHPDPEALRVLARAARNDRVSDVRSEAAESVSEMQLPQATDTLIVLARTLSDHKARQEAVEGLAERDDAKSLAAAASIAREDASKDVRSEAVETLGEFSGGAGLPALLQIVKSDPSSDIRQEAVETIAEAAGPDEAIRILNDVIRTEREENVLREAVETLGDIESPKAFAVLRDLAGSHANPAVRVEAVETLGQGEAGPEVAELLHRIAVQDADEEVQREAVETLGELQDPAALDMVARVAREHPRNSIRQEAVETLGENMEPEAAIRVLKSIATNDRSAEVQVEAVETMGDLPGDIAIPALIEIARNHPAPDVRAEAVETLGESQGDDRRAVDAIMAIARSDKSQRVTDEAIETLGEIGSLAALGVVAEVASKHPDPEVRRQAVEAIGQSPDPGWAIQQLTQIARQGNDFEVQQEAVETLGEVEDPRVVSELINLARTHPNEEVRAEAIETLTEIETSVAVVNALSSIAMTDPSVDLEEKALEALAELEDDQGIPAVIKAARSHPNRELRQKALEILGDSDSPMAQQLIDSMLR